MNLLLRGIITSKTRIKILMSLFLNPDQETHLRGLAHEFNASPSLIKKELKQLADCGLLLNNNLINKTERYIKRNKTACAFREKVW